MEKMKAKVIKKRVTKYFVEVDNGTEKLLVGKSIGGFVKFDEWDTEKEAKEYIENCKHLELVEA